LPASERLAHFQQGRFGRGLRQRRHGHGQGGHNDQKGTYPSRAIHDLIMDNKDGQCVPDSAPSQPASGHRKAGWRKALIDKRQSLADRAWRNDRLQRGMRVWLIDRPDAVIGAYWPIKGEFDPLPALFRWQEAGLEEDAQSAARQRRIGLPVVNKIDKTLT